MLGHAFHAEGFELVASYERDRVAAATHRLNLPGEVFVDDLSTLTPRGSCDLIIAGPPCQGFSSIGRRDSSDPRNSMCLIIPDWVKATGAVAAVIENVPAFVGSEPCKKMIARLRRMGFKVRSFVLNAKDYGVAQNRWRSFTICTKVGNIPDIEKLPKQPSVSVREAFAKLPVFPDNSIHHFTREQSSQAKLRMSLVPPGGDIRDLAKAAPHLVPPSWFKTKGKVIDIWGRIPWDGVSNTLRTGFLNPSRGRFLHPDENRPISFREAARLQGLPDSFQFSGTPQQIARQIGNGVPIGLGRTMARAVLHSIYDADAVLARS